MAKRTIRQRIIAGLEARGEKLVKRTAKRDVYTCTREVNDGRTVYFYVGHIDSLRIGTTVESSVPTALKAKILQEQV